METLTKNSGKTQDITEADYVEKVERIRIKNAKLRISGNGLVFSIRKAYIEDGNLETYKPYEIIVNELQGAKRTFKAKMNKEICGTTDYRIYVDKALFENHVLSGGRLYELVIFEWIPLRQEVMVERNTGKISSKKKEFNATAPLITHSSFADWGFYDAPNDQGGYRTF